jgi:hypothetical protein
VKCTVERIVADLAEHRQVETDARYRELLGAAAEIVDGIERIKELIAAKGETITLKDGRLIMHPGICEIRLQQAALVKVLNSMDLDGLGANNPVKQAAANARWKSQRGQGPSDGHRPLDSAAWSCRGCGSGCGRRGFTT